MSKAPSKGDAKPEDAAASKTEAKEKKPAPARPLTALEVLYKNVDRLQKAASHHDSSAAVRVLRSTPIVRYHLKSSALSGAVETFVSNADDKDRILRLLSSSSQMDAAEDVTMAGPEPAVLDPPEASPPAVVPGFAAEVCAYFEYVAIALLVKQSAWEQVAAASRFALEKLNAINRRSLDVFASKLWAFLSLAHERIGDLASIRSLLHDAHRTACLRHDEFGQATLLNLLVRNYLAYNLYDQANKLISKASFPEGVSNNQLVRFLFYKGRIQAVQLDYSDALNTLTHADRKTPAVIAKGFRAEVKKFLIVVQLLIGEIPERSVFELEDLKATLVPYLAVTQNVIKAGLRKIWMSYSRISFADIATKLHLESPEDAEFLCAKAIRDGVLEASLNHDEGYLCSKEVSDAYSTTEPQVAFDRRIKFSLEVHNEAVKAMSYPPAPETKDNTADLEREREDLALAEEVDHLDDMDDDDL